MLALAMAALSVAASGAPPAQPGSLKNQPVRICRALVSGYSRSGDISICRTKAEWARWQNCHRPTVYCEPPQRASLGPNTPFPLNEDSRVVCRILKVTGSRLSSQRTCLPQREWQRLWDESRSTMGSLQDRFSKRLPDGAR